MSEILTVAGVDCPHCAAQVRKELEGLNGVVGVEVDLPAQTARVTFDPALVSREKVAAVIEDAGFDIER